MRADAVDAPTGERFGVVENRYRVRGTLGHGCLGFVDLDGRHVHQGLILEHDVHLCCRGKNDSLSVIHEHVELSLVAGVG